MDSDELNRELQIFRNHVKIARENIIHKLVRDIKFWKQKQDANSDDARAAKKIQSLEPLISYIKAQTTAGLARAIIKFKPPVANATHTGLRKRMLLRFREHKKLQPEIAALIKRFGLEGNMSVVNKYLKNPRAKGKEKTNRNDKKEGNNEGKVSKKKEELDVAQSDDEGFREVEQDQSADEVETDDDQSSIDNISISEPEESNDGESDPEEAGKFVRLTKAKEEIARKAPEQSTKEKASTKKDGKNGKKVSLAIKSPEEEDAEDECIKIQDSFFVTSSGQSYVATAPKVNKKAQDEEVEFSWKRANKRKDIMGNKEEWPSKKPNHGEADDIHPSWRAKQQQKGINQFQGQRKHFNDDSGDRITNHHNKDTDLHPSWAAKQRQKSLLAPAGKKITFDDANMTEASGELHPSWAAKQKQKAIQPFAGKKTVFDCNEQSAGENTSANDLHPSWAAKQKQKGLKPFEGKKITFDATMEPQQASQPDLHPSWAAKQKEKGIKAFQGKKITFDD